MTLITSQPCIDCQAAPPMPGMLRCEACHEMAILKQVRAILDGADIPVTADHLRAQESIIAAQAATIHELQGVVRTMCGQRELSGVEASQAVTDAFKRRVRA